jgi:tetratricopeptide (TPR) repeat protein
MPTDRFPKRLPPAALLALLAAGCAAPRDAGTVPAPAPASAAAALAPPASAAQRDAMLDIAFEVARQFPDRPFIKDRAKYEGMVVDALLSSGQLAAAADRAERSCFTWRRAESFALLADRQAAAGDPAAARANADRALVELGRLEEVRDWAADRVRAAVARVMLRLGDAQRAAALLNAEVPALEAGLAAFRAEVAPARELDSCADAFDRGIATQDFDLARAGMDGYHAILRRSGADPGRRDRAMKALDAAVPGLPVDLQVEYRLRTADALESLGMRAEAVTEARRAADAFGAARFVTEDQAPVGAPVARELVRLGDRERGLALLASLEESYARGEREVVDIRRARCLRALAEARAAVGEPGSALDLYARALEAGTLNPNARPRADDLCATCVSLAGSGIAAPAPFLARIAEIRAGLVDPW